MTETRLKILEALSEMSDRYPQWRFGQMVSNVSFWALGPTTQSIWDVDDDAFLQAIRKHLTQMT